MNGAEPGDTVEIKIRSIDLWLPIAGMSTRDALMLLSAAMDLQITKIVNGTKGVHAMLPKASSRNSCGWRAEGATAHVAELTQFP